MTDTTQTQTWDDIQRGQTALSNIDGVRDWVTTGRCHDDIATYLYYTWFDRKPSEHDKTDPLFTARLAVMRELLRLDIQRMDNALAFANKGMTERARREALDQARAATASRFRQQHVPAAAGTVKELAAKYGRSLSEIRRMKSEGRLHELQGQAMS